MQVTLVHSGRSPSDLMTDVSECGHHVAGFCGKLTMAVCAVLLKDLALVSHLP